MPNRLSVFGPDGQRKYLSWPEREAFFKVVKSCSDIEKRAFCLTLFYTGCRLSEALELTGERVDFSEKALVIRTLKRRDTKHFRVVPIPSTLVELLDQLVMEKESFVDRLWPHPRPWGYRLVKKYMKLANIAGIKACPKGLRHSFAVAYVSRNVPVTTVQRWMGHASLETTAIYLEMTGEEDRKQAEKLWRTI